MAKSGGATVIAFCENCGQPSKKRCSRCKAFSVCCQACMAKVWSKHKSDCDNVVEARKKLQASGEFLSDGVPFLIDPETLLRLNGRALDVYRKHGVEEPPERGSKMDATKKLDFFLEVLEVHDTSSPENKNLPLAEKMFLNRRYNNTYRHAVNTFTEEEFTQLNALMRLHHVGETNRMVKEDEKAEVLIF
jgi:hypothetical protein